MIVTNKTFDEERALYGSENISLQGCKFDGPQDGESALKESSDINITDCYFNLRYPLWHDKNLVITKSYMTENCRAALWYSNNIKATDTKFHGIKALRECDTAAIKDCDIVSPEFGWFCHNITVEDCTAESEYFMMHSDNLTFKNLTFKGKYSFQYIKNATFENCIFDTKDAFWHGENIVVKNSIVKGEYLGWYSDNVVFDNCKIAGTQPLCYCKNLRLINCEMTDCDLAFEKSDVTATVTTHVISIKNPTSGTITVPSVGEIIRDDKTSHGEIILREAIL